MLLNSRASVRASALMCVEALFGKLAEEYLVLLPETIPFLVRDLRPLPVTLWWIAIFRVSFSGIMLIAFLNHVGSSVVTQNGSFLTQNGSLVFVLIG